MIFEVWGALISTANGRALPFTEIKRYKEKLQTVQSIDCWTLLYREDVQPGRILYEGSADPAIVLSIDGDSNRVLMLQGDETKELSQLELKILLKNEWGSKNNEGLLLVSDILGWERECGCSIDGGELSIEGEEIDGWRERELGCKNV